MLIRRLKRAIKIFKTLEYAGWSWWINNHTILADRMAINYKRLQFILNKIKVAWILANWYEIKNDGVYSILKESKKEILYYRITY